MAEIRGDRRGAKRLNLGSVHVTEDEMRKLKFQWELTRLYRESFSAWVRRNLIPGARPKKKGK